MLLYKLISELDMLGSEMTFPRNVETAAFDKTNDEVNALLSNGVYTIESYSGSAFKGIR